MWLLNYVNNMNIAGYFLRIWNIMVCNEQHANVRACCTPLHVIHHVVIKKVHVTDVVVNCRMWFHSLRKSTVEAVELLVPVWELRESWRFWTRYVCILCHRLQTVHSGWDGQVTGFSPWRARFDLRLVHMGSVVDKVTMEQVCVLWWTKWQWHRFVFCGGQSDNGTGLCFVVDKVTMEQVCVFWWTKWQWNRFVSQNCTFSMSLSFHQLSTLRHYHQHYVSLAIDSVSN